MSERARSKAGADSTTVEHSPTEDRYVPKGIHLVGSVRLQDAGTVFETVCGIVGDRLRRISDGETGVRSRWSSWTAPSYERTEGLELLDPLPGSYTPWKQARLTIPPDQLVLERLGFADAALASYRLFAQSKAVGMIPQRMRFQVCLPSPVAPMITLIEEGSRAEVEPAHLRQLFSEIDEMLDRIPHEELAIQWDVCHDVGVWEGYFPAYFDDPKGGVIERLVRLGEAIPEDVELGVHLCYGDFGHAHFMQPKDLRVLTELANALVAGLHRRLDWLHLPVPIDRDDDAYFAPLSGLELGAETELYLGLLHYADGVEGAQRRIAVAHHYADGFGVATECGFGRREPETIPRLLELHREVSAPI